MNGLAEMRIFQRNISNVVAKSVASGIRIFRAYILTALPMDYATEARALPNPGPNPASGQLGLGV
jgi:hypothetical protein